MIDSKLGQECTEKNQRILLSGMTTELCVAELEIQVAVELEVKESGITLTRAIWLAVNLFALCLLLPSTAAIGKMCGQNERDASSVQPTTA